MNAVRDIKANEPVVDFGFMKRSSNVKVREIVDEVASKLFLGTAEDAAQLAIEQIFEASEELGWEDLKEVSDSFPRDAIHAWFGGEEMSEDTVFESLDRHNCIENLARDFKNFGGDMLRGALDAAIDLHRVQLERRTAIESGDLEGYMADLASHQADASTEYGEGYNSWITTQVKTAKEQSE